MSRCWKRSENHVEKAGITDGGPAVSPYFLHKAFWMGLAASLVLVLIVLVLTGHLGASRPPHQTLQVVRLTAQDPTGVLVNQSAVVDRQNDLVTLSVTSHMNQTSTVLFDIRHGLICYKPVDQEGCFLQHMEMSDYDNVHSLLNESSHQQHQIQLNGNETRRRMEFLKVLEAARVDVSTLEESLQFLCRDRSVHWTRRAEGPGKQRLVYFCIDICFPSNICVSVCFYYLPE